MTLHKISEAVVMCCPICETAMKDPFRCEEGHQICTACVRKVVFDDGLRFMWICPFCIAPYALEREHIVHLIRSGRLCESIASTRLTS